MAIQIGNQGTITASTRITVDSAKPFFNFIFNQQYASSALTVLNISGFTSTPSFTPTSNAFTFNSIGTPTGTIIFGFTMTSNIALTMNGDLYYNGDFLQNTGFQTVTSFTSFFSFTPIAVSPNSTVQIVTYTSD